MVRIYLITNKINNKKYVGKTRYTLEHRFKQHCYKYSGCVYLSKSINKYGKENFIIEELFSVFNEDDYVYFENYFINKYNTIFPNGLNAIPSNYKGDLTIEQKQRLSKAQDNRKTPLIGVSIEDGSLFKVPSVSYAQLEGYDPIQCLGKRKNIQSGGYCWFYDKGQSDEFFIEKAKELLGGEFGTYKRSKLSWKNPEIRQKRIVGLKKSAKDRELPIIGISRFDASIIEFPSINDARRAGYTVGSLYQSLNQTCIHAYNYVWFYKEHDNIDKYKKEAIRRLGKKFDDTNIKPIIATNIKTGEILNFNKLDDVIEKGFNRKNVRRVLIGKNKQTQGWTFKFA